MAAVIAWHGESTKMSACCKILKFGQEECLLLIWKYIEDKNGERDYSKNIWYAFPQTVQGSWKIRNLKQEEETVSQLSDVMWKLCQEFIKKKKRGLRNEEKKA
jgi:hypothetical protein